MTLATHIVTGATVAAVLTKDPVAGFFAGWISHYLLDSIPHWDYKIRSFEAKDESKPLEKKVEFGSAIFQDIGKVLLDACLGFLVLYISVFFSNGGIGGLGTQTILVLLLGAIGGTFPDFLQFFYGLWNVWPLRKLQEFHHFIHAKTKLNDKPHIGVPMQIGIISLAGLILLYLR